MGLLLYPGSDLCEEGAILQAAVNDIPKDRRKAPRSIETESGYLDITKFTRTMAMGYYTKKNEPAR